MSLNKNNNFMTFRKEYNENLEDDYEEYRNKELYSPSEKSMLTTFKTQYCKTNFESSTWSDENEDFVVHSVEDDKDN